MRPLLRQILLLGTSILAAAVALLSLSDVQGQQFLLGVPPRFELTAPQLDMIPGTTRARLEQVRALVADRQWDEAVDILRDVAADDVDRGKVVALDEGSYVSLPIYCQLQVSHLPPEGLAAYRRQVDATAERWYRDGLAARDSALLNRVIDEAYCSSWGDDALVAAGELALERGDYAAARRTWQAVSPLVRDPQGRTPWAGLHDVELVREWSKINRTWQDRPAAAPTWLAFPDTNLELADVRARLVLVSIREGDFERAAFELELFRRLHPQAAGRFAGRDGLYATALSELLKSARDWPAAASVTDWATYAGAPTRNSHVVPLDILDTQLWPTPIALGKVAATKAPPAVVRESELPLNYHPLIVDGRVYLNDSRQIHALELKSGKPAITANGLIYLLDVRAVDGVSVETTGTVAAGVPRYTMTAVDGILYARLGESVTGRLQPNHAWSDERLIGIDLNREGLLAFQVKPDDGTWSFDGAPVGDGRNVYVAMRHSDVRPGAYVAAFDSATGRRTWRMFLAAADTPAAGRGDEVTHNLLTLVGDRIFVNTNLGVVASLAVEDGRVVWLRRYDRSAGKLPVPGPIYFDRIPSPCVYDRGLVFVAPADTPQVFALDADTGQTVWTNDTLAGVTHLLAVANGQLIASGNQLWALDARSGRVRFAWPEGEHAGVRGFGRGLVAGREVFWPTRERVYVMDVLGGQQTREPIDITAFTTNGANLAAADGRLLIVGQDRMMALGPRPGPKPRRQEAEAADAVALNETGRGRGRPGSLTSNNFHD